MTAIGRSLGDRDFTRLWTASSVSGLGSALSVIAYPLLVLSQGGSMAQAGSVLSASLIACTLLRLVGGHVADFVAPRPLLVSVDLVRLVVVGSVPVAMAAGPVALPQLLVVSVLEGAATAFYLPQVLLRATVPGERLPRALSRFQASTGTIAMIGPPLGGALFAVGPALPFALDAGSYGCSALLLLTTTARSTVRARQRPDRRVTAGLRWLWRNPAVIRVLVFAGLLNLVAGGTEIVVLVGLREHGATSLTVGVVIACMGVGTVLGAFVAERTLDLLVGSRLYVTVGLAWALGAGALGLAPTPWVTGGLLAALTLLAPAAGIRLSDVTLRQAPADLVGRVNTATRMVNLGLASAGPGLAGLLLGAVGAPMTWAVLSSLCLTAVAVTAAPGRPS